ncbi:MAG: DUF86 domain-containing protein [Planctomycetota bacterium]
MKDDRVYLTHIREAIERIEGYTAEGRDAFMADPMVQDAVVRNFEIIGEATKRLTSALTQSRQDVPWRDIAGFRDVLIHNYMGVDLVEVWNIIAGYLPELRTVVDELLADA